MYKIWLNGVKRLSDCSFIPNDETLPDWREYLNWVAEGNTPEPEFTTEELAAIQAYEQLMAQRQQDIADNLPSWSEIDTAITNATTVAALKVIIRRMARVVYWLAKNQAT